MTKIAEYINQVPEPKTKRALQKIFETIQSDMAANKAVFDAHTHIYYATSASSVSSGPADASVGRNETTDAAFTVTLES